MARGERGDEKERYRSNEDNVPRCGRIMLRSALDGKVLISNPIKTHLIAESHVKTDKVDGDVLAQLA